MSKFLGEADPASVVLEETHRPSIADAVSWLAEDHPMPASTSWTQLLRALVQLDRVDEEALHRVTREVANSDLDTSRVIFDSGDLPSAAQFAAAVEALLSRSKDGSFGGLTPRGVLRAQDANPLAVETLCLAAGVPYADAVKWFRSGGSWTVADLGRLLEYFDRLVCGEVETNIPGATPTRAIELIEDDSGGWARVDELNAGGVPYELLLAQRAVGSPWLAHKNKTSRYPNQTIAEIVCGQLEQRQIDFRRSRDVGGTVRSADMQELSGIPDKRVGVVVVDSGGVPTFVVTFSTARDGGTARANGDGLLQIPAADLPHAIVLNGIGWSRRHETTRLALRFDGLLFSEDTVGDLVDCIEEATA